MKNPNPRKRNPAGRLVVALSLWACLASNTLAQVYDLPTFRQQALDAHNRWRQQHDAEPLALDDALNTLAQEWANNLAKRDVVEHRPGSNFGENIYAAWGSASPFDVHGRVAVQAWYDEIKLYNFNKPDFSMATGHFTQVVWKGSRFVGCGKAKSSTGKVFVVCNYDPQGNYLGQFQDNVIRAK